MKISGMFLNSKDIPASEKAPCTRLASERKAAKELINAKTGVECAFSA